MNEHASGTYTWSSAYPDAPFIQVRVYGGLIHVIKQILPEAFRTVPKTVRDARTRVRQVCQRIDAVDINSNDIRKHPAVLSVGITVKKKNHVLHTLDYCHGIVQQILQMTTGYRFRAEDVSIDEDDVPVRQRKQPLSASHHPSRLH